MIRDRGRIKWAAFMIPQHRKMLGNLFNEQDDEEMPLLEEDQLGELHWKILDYLAHNIPVRIRYYAGKRKHSVEGTLLKVDALARSLQLLQQEEPPITIHLERILDVEKL